MTNVTNSHIELDAEGRAWIVGANTKVIENERLSHTPITEMRARARQLYELHR